MKKMVKISSKLLFLSLFTISIVTTQSCKTAEGCQLESKYSVKTDKDGNLSTKRGKSGLWSKKQKKKMKKRNK